MITQTEIDQAHKELKAAQDKLEPVLPLRFMAEILKTHSMSYVQELVKELVKQGKAKRVPYKRYRIT